MIPLAKNIKRYFSLREITIVLLAIVISVSAGVGVFLGLKKEVVINDNGKQIVIKTMKSTVKDVLEQNGIELGESDYISQPLNAKLQRKNNNIEIKKAVPVNVQVDGQQVQLMTYRSNVKDAIANSSIKISLQDRFDGVKPEDVIVEGMNIKIVRVKEDVVKEQVPIPYAVVNMENERLDSGLEQVVRDGSEGIKENQYKIVYEDGKEISRSLLAENILKNPLDKIIEYGTLLVHNTARGGTVRYTKVLDMRATAYTASYRDTGKSSDNPHFGITSSGVQAQMGIVAVDPNVIPMGTRLYIEVAGSTPDYGYAVAGDTGGAIKGDLIDVYLDSQSEADAWGIKRVKVYFLQD